MGVPPGDRVKNSLTEVVVDMLAIQQLADRRVVINAEPALMDRHWKVQISEHPSDARGLGGLMWNLDVDDGFRELFNGIHMSRCRKERFSVVQRMLQIKSKFGSIFSNSSPATFGQLQSVDFEEDRLGSLRMGVWQRSVDEVHNEGKSEGAGAEG